jgi:hypothetical protein
MDEQTKQRFQAELMAARDRLATEASPAGPLPETLVVAVAGTLNAVERMSQGIDEQQAAFGNWMETQYALQDAVARVAVMFPPRRRIAMAGWRVHFDQPPSPALVAANEVVVAFGAAASVVLDERRQRRNPDFGNETVDNAFAATAPVLPAFALATSRTARRLLL